MGESIVIALTSIYPRQLIDIIQFFSNYRGEGHRKADICETCVVVTADFCDFLTRPSRLSCEAQILFVFTFTFSFFHVSKRLIIPKMTREQNSLLLKLKVNTHI